MNKIKFNAQLHNSGHRILSISGKLGKFIFRTRKNGMITAYYKQPENESLCSQDADILESLSDQLRTIADQLGLSITQINFSS